MKREDGWKEIFKIYLIQIKLNILKKNIILLSFYSNIFSQISSGISVFSSFSQNGFKFL